MTQKEYDHYFCNNYKLWLNEKQEMDQKAKEYFEYRQSQNSEWKSYEFIGVSYEKDGIYIRYSMQDRNKKFWMRIERGTILKPNELMQEEFWESTLPALDTVLV